MATLNMEGLRETIVKIKNMGENAGPICKAMLKMGANVMIEGYHYSLMQHGHVKGGTLLKSIKARKPKTSGGIPSIKVEPVGMHGKERRKPISNKQLAYVLDHGRHGDGWAAEAYDKSEGQAITVMENVFDEWLWTGGEPGAGADWADYAYWE